MSVITAIESIVETSAFREDVSLLTELLVNAVALEQFVDKKDPFIHTVAYLCAIHRFYLKQMGEVKDIDQTPYLDLFRNEVGMGLPAVTNIPVIEFIREAKSWGGHKGTLGLYKFIGQLIGSPVEINVLNKKIMTLDTRATVLDGAASTSGLLSFDESKLGFVRDGIFYAYYTYMIKVLQAQNVVNFNDLYALLDNVHPAGFKEFLLLNDMSLNTGGFFDPIYGSHTLNIDSFYSCDY